MWERVDDRIRLVKDTLDEIDEYPSADLKLTPNDLIAMLQELGFGYRPPVGPKLHEDPLPEGTGVPRWGPHSRRDNYG